MSPAISASSRLLPAKLPWPLPTELSADEPPWAPSLTTAVNLRRAARPQVSPREVGCFIGLVRTPPEQRDMAAIAEAIAQAGKLWAILDARIAAQGWIAADHFTLADIACFPWVVTHKAQGFTLDDFTHVKRVLAAFLARPAVARGLSIPKRPG